MNDINNRSKGPDRGPPILQVHMLNFTLTVDEWPRKLSVQASHNRTAVRIVFRHLNHELTWYAYVVVQIVFKCHQQTGRIISKFKIDVGQVGSGFDIFTKSEYVIRVVVFV